MTEQGPRVVVGVDGSRHSQRALVFALREAELRRARLDVVYAYRDEVPELHRPAVLEEDPLSFTGRRRGGGATDETGYRESLLRQDESHEREDARALSVVERAFENVDVPPGVTWRAVPMSSRHPAEALLDVARGAELLVVGTRGRGGFAGLVLGSVSQQCVHQATVPVTVVRGDEAARG
jgi:nucleotide-binding universal stress UspA family protein